MLHDFDKTLEKIVYDDGKIPRKDVDIAFDQPTGEWSAKLNRPTLNMWCFDLRENVKLRRPDMDRRVQDNRGMITRPPRRMDASYLVTAWARRIEDEHQLLWRVLRTLKSMYVIPLERCEGELAYQNFDIPLIVADMTDFPVNVSDLWSVLDNQMKLGFLLVATLELPIDFLIEAPLVLHASLEINQIIPENAPAEAEEKPSIETVRDGVTGERTDKIGDGLTPDIRIVHKAKDVEDDKT